MSPNWGSLSFHYYIQNLVWGVLLFFRVFCFVLFCSVLLLLFRAAPMAYGSSWAMGGIGAAAA